MLLHLPIAILATLSPIHVSHTVPTFDIVRECRYEGGSAANVERCSQDETAALGQLKTEWVQFVGTDKRSCKETTQIGGFASYVELLTCLEMARDVVSASANPENLRAKSGSRSTRPSPRGVRNASAVPKKFARQPEKTFSTVSATSCHSITAHCGRRRAAPAPGRSSA